MDVMICFNFSRLNPVTPDIRFFKRLLITLLLLGMVGAATTAARSLPLNY